MLAATSAPDTALTPGHPAVCGHLDQAFKTARGSRPRLGPLVDALREISGSLHWAARAGSENGDPDFASGHANAVLVGRDGLEPREDVRIGLSLMAPNIRYPDHRHPPEEIYVVFSQGEWKQDDAPWFSPGIGGVLYNPPGILHAMRSGDAPLLAAWCLWDKPH